MRAVAIVVLLTSGTASADEGEGYVGAGVVLDAAWLRHPRKNRATLPDAGTPIAFLPHLNTSVHYGLSNELHAGLGIEGAAAQNVVTNDVAIGGTSATLITGAYLEVAAPLTVSWRFDTGQDATGVAAFDAAPMLTLWSASALADPTKVDTSGHPARLPVQVRDALDPGIVVRLRAVLQVRLLQTLALTLGPTVAFAWAGTPSLRLGVALEPSLISSPTPR
ncbi:MAG: hypothetical protein IT383_27380 [Deltaproteobacteria bacterium]|nr:hypothetical protein [Deltaproteobacteria bacterium]